MTQKPTLIFGLSDFRIEVDATIVDQLVEDLRAAGFDPELLEGKPGSREVDGWWMLNKEANLIRLPFSSGWIALSEFMRSWKPE